MNKTEHLMVCLNEECVEIAHATDKALRFGLSDGHPATSRTNLGDISEKKGRVLKFMKYAEDNGSIT